MKIINVIRFIYYYIFPQRQNVDFNRVARILIIRNDHIGDLCLTLPCIEYLKLKFPDIKIDILINEYTYDLVSNNPTINNIISQKSNDNLDNIIRKLGRYDIILNMCSTAFNAKLCSKIQAEYKAGYAYKLYNIINLNRFIFVHRTNPPIHESLFCIKFLEALGVSFSAEIYEEAIAKIKIHINTDIMDYCESYKDKLDFLPGKKIVGIHPGDNKSAFNLKLEKYIELAEILSEKNEIVFILGPAEKDMIKKISEQQYAKFKFVKGDLTLKQLCGFVSKIDCLISGSTGPMHIAGLMGTPTISFFSNKPSHSYKKWHPIKNKYKIIEPEIKYSKKNKADIMDTIDLQKIKSYI